MITYDKIIAQNQRQKRLILALLPRVSDKSEIQGLIDAVMEGNDEVSEIIDSISLTTVTPATFDDYMNSHKEELVRMLMECHRIIEQEREERAKLYERLVREV